MVFGTLWFYVVITLIELRKYIDNFRILIYHLLLQGTVLPYAYLHFTNSPSKVFVQKFAILGLMIVLELIVIEIKGYRKRHTISKLVIIKH